MLLRTTLPQLVWILRFLVKVFFVQGAIYFLPLANRRQPLSRPRVSTSAWQLGYFDDSPERLWSQHFLDSDPFIGC